jgi:predicted RecB family nuclease
MNSESNTNNTNSDKKMYNVNEYIIDFNRKVIQLIIEKKQNINYHWISASKLYNYMNDELLLDWLNLYGKNKGYKTDEEIEYQEYCDSLTIDQSVNKLSFDDFIKKNHEYNFMKYILEQGIIYEKYVYNMLKNKYNEKFVNVDECGFQKFEYDKKLEKTRHLILNNTPIIYQGLVCDPDTKTFGFPDLIVREDYLYDFIENPVNKLNTTEQQYYNYYIIDIKFHTLEYKKDSNNLIPNPSQQQYISQMYLYTKGLRHLIHPSVLKCCLLEHKSYIIGRSWKNNGDKSIGCIDFKLYDRVLDKTKNGIELYKELKYNGKSWDPLNRNIYELYPNMKNDKDNNWRKTKQIIAEKLGEITMIWNCGTSIRLKAHTKNIYSWRDPEFNILNYMNDIEISILINDIIKINNQCIRLFDYDKTKIIENNWMSENSFSFVNQHNILMDGFIDIENTFDIRSIDTPKEDSIIYMLGLYYNELPISQRTKKYREKMTHKTFCVNSLDKIQEKEMIEEFLLYLKSFNCDKHITWRLYHYSGIEKYTLNKLLGQYNMVPEDYGVTIIWIDLCDILIKYKFVFKNCFDYSIKSINKILNQLKYIPDNCIYRNSLIKNGLDSIIALYKCDDKSKTHNINFNKIDIMEDIIYYNMIDCISLYYLRNFIQENVSF